MSLCGNPDRADDLVQETLLKAWGNRNSFTPGTNARPGSSPSCATSSTPSTASGAARWRTPTARWRPGWRPIPPRTGTWTWRTSTPRSESAPDQREALILIGAVGPLLRGGGADLRLRGRHDQEPRQQGAEPTGRTALREHGGRLWTGFALAPGAQPVHPGGHRGPVTSAAGAPGAKPAFCRAKMRHDRARARKGDATLSLARS